MDEIFRPMINQVPYYLACIALFALLEYLRPFGRGHQARSAAFYTDLSYLAWALTLRTPLLFWSFICYEKALLAVFPGVTTRRELLSALPFWLQATSLMILGDMLYYFAHRLMHNRLLWRFHAAHHLPTNLGWLSSLRQHPMEGFIKRGIPMTVLAPLGYSAEAGAVGLEIALLFGYIGHANLNWDFGPFRKIFVSPLFHRFHHSREISGKNLGGIFSCWDALFGTYYLPKLARAEDLPLGIDEKLPEGFLRQTWHGFFGRNP